MAGIWRTPVWERLLRSGQRGVDFRNVLSPGAGRLPALSLLWKCGYFLLSAALVGFGFAGIVGRDGSGVVFGGFGATPRRTAAVPGSFALIDVGGRDSVSRPRRFAASTVGAARNWSAVMRF